MTYATRTATTQGPFPAEVQAAVSGMLRRLLWPSMHWKAAPMTDESWPHMAAAALDAAGPMIEAKASARELLAAVDDLILECASVTEDYGACDDCAAQGEWLEKRANAILERAGLTRADLMDVAEPTPAR